MKVDVLEICYHALEDGVRPIMAVDVHTEAAPAADADKPSDVAAAPLYTRLVTAGTDHMARVWHLHSDAAAEVTAAASTSAAGVTAAAVAALRRTQVTFLADLAGSDKPINVVKFSPNGRFIAAAGDDSCITIWRRSDKKPAAGAPSPAVVASPKKPAESPKKAEAAAPATPSQGQGQGQAEEATSGAVIDLTQAMEAAATCKAEEGATAPATESAAVPATPAAVLAPVPTPAPVASAATPFGVDPSDLVEQHEVWDIHLRLRGHLYEIYDLCWSPSGHDLLSSSIDGTMHIWSLATGLSVHQAKEHQGFIQGVAWDPLDQFIATQGSDRTVRLYERSRKRGAKGAFVAGAVLRWRKAARLGGGGGVLAEELVPMEEEATPGSPAEAGGEEDVVMGSSSPRLVPMSPSTKGAALGSGSGGGVRKDKDRSHITRPLFADDSHICFFRRLSFSPDGAFLVTPAGTCHADEIGRGTASNGIGGGEGGGEQQQQQQGGTTGLISDEMDPSQPELNLLAENKAELSKADAAAAAIKEADKAGLNQVASLSARASLPTVYIFGRADGFATPLMHLPQLDPVVAVKFCPRLFQRRLSTTTSTTTTPAKADVSEEAVAVKAETTTEVAGQGAEVSTATPAVQPASLNTPAYRQVFAIATSKSVLVYDTESLFPLVVIKNIHAAGLTDLAWTPCGSTLISSSSDGYCAYMTLNHELKEMGTPLTEAEMSSHRAWWSLKRVLLHSALLACSQAPSEGKKKKSLGGGAHVADGSEPAAKARTAIVTLLGAEPAPLPTRADNAPATPSAATAAGAASSSGSASKHHHHKRPDGEIMQHALELLQAGERLNTSRLLNDCGSSTKRLKKILADVDAIQLNAHKVAFAPELIAALPQAPVVDFESTLAAALRVQVGSNLREAPKQPRPAKFVYSLTPRPATATTTTVAAAAPVVAAAAAAAAASVPAAAAVAAATVPESAGAISEPIIIDASPAPSAVPMADSMAEPSSSAAPPTTVAAPTTPAAVTSSSPIPASPAKVRPTSSSPHSTPVSKGAAAAAAAAASHSGSQQGSKKRGRPVKTIAAAGGDVKPKITIDQMFKKAAAKVPATHSSTCGSGSGAAAGSSAAPAPASSSSASALQSPSAAAAAPTSVVDLSADDVAVVHPRAKRRITPTQPDATAEPSAANASPSPSSSISASGSPTSIPVLSVPSKTNSPARSPSSVVDMIGEDGSSSSEDGSEGAEEVYVVEAILKRRAEAGGAVKYWVKWQGYDASHNSWEPLENLEGCMDLVEKFEKSQKRRRVIPTLLCDQPLTPAPAAAPAAASASSPPPAPAAAAVPVPVGATSIAALAASGSPRKRRAEENGVEQTTSPLAAAAGGGAADPVHVPDVKKAKRKITPQAL